jgi:hypothetical protein
LQSEKYSRIYSNLPRDAHLGFSPYADPGPTFFCRARPTEHLGHLPLRACTLSVPSSLAPKIVRLKEKTRICKVPEEEFDFLGYSVLQRHIERVEYELKSVS